MAKLSPEELLTNLAQFTGTTQWYRHPLYQGLLYTDGIQYLAENAGCYWLIDYVFSNQVLPKVEAQEFQVWKISVNENSEAKIWVEDGNYNVVMEFEIPFTDFPLSAFTLYFTNKVLLLPSEY